MALYQHDCGNHRLHIHYNVLVLSDEEIAQHQAGNRSSKPYRLAVMWGHRFLAYLPQGRRNINRFPKRDRLA